MRCSASRSSEFVASRSTKAAENVITNHKPLVMLGLTCERAAQVVELLREWRRCLCHVAALLQQTIDFLLQELAAGAALILKKKL